jgi:hypothetical protein
VVERTCADRSYGARPLRRALQKYVEDPLSEALIQGTLGNAPLIEVFVDGTALNFRPVDGPLGSADLLTELGSAELREEDGVLVS